ncbi:phytoene desaturase family protein [Enhygromyxa salina]|uniref:Zeta-carotene-forming phytoene desaturase n=1 Tax=Enhygromyxa salina TaxID=215803 RepID=A0A2S9YW82_9BACT|nr:NAD(P)/FAD-dependent oxidoreductase [Enhygromyxa salina]PRQ09371.1 zeta-carotene-forming phytoene desaturase [Enhygromyxa salina]
MSDFDAIVIGSGTGGMTAAAALARAGKRVVVFEQHYLIGGYSQTFPLEGFRFSPGVHYVGDLGPGGGLRRMYEGLGLGGDLGFFELNPDGFEHIVIGDERFDMPKGMEPLRERLKSRFPAEAAGIDGYLDTVDRMAAELRPTMPDSLVGKLAMVARMPMTLRCGLLPLSRFLDRFTQNPLLRAILTIQAGDHGMAPSRAPAIVHAGLQRYYMDGGWYPRGGAHAIPDALRKQVQAHRGEVHLRTPVERVLIENGRAIGVELSDGVQVRANIVVSNVDPVQLWGRMIRPQHVHPLIRRRIRSLPLSHSTACLFFATNMDLRAAGLDSGNIWYSRTPNIDATYELGERREFADVGALPGLFLSITTLKDPTLRKDKLHTGEAIFFASWDAFSRWQTTDPDQRPAAYEAKKEMLRQRIVDTLERLIPGLRDHIVFSAVGTPLTNARYTRATRGAVYGPELSLFNIGPFRLPIQTRIPGLFQCGSSTLAPGIHAVTRSGLAAAAAALACPIDELLREGERPLQVWQAESPDVEPARRRVAVGR